MSGNHVEMLADLKLDFDISAGLWKPSSSVIHPIYMVALVYFIGSQNM